MYWTVALLALALVGDASSGETAVRIAQQSARWTGLAPVDDLQGAGETMFLISGTVENTGAKPVAWVKLGYELLAGSGADAVVVASEYGYNRRAESLRAPSADDTVPALAPGETDLFRMVFFRADVPRFDTWRVRILEAH